MYKHVQYSIEQIGRDGVIRPPSVCKTEHLVPGLS
jgi:hypothetical protein